MNFDRLTALLDSFPTIGIPGVDCAVFVDHEPVYRHMAGFSDKENQIPMNGNETYYIYSCSKPITCAAVLSLLEEGKFLLTDPLYEYIPEFRDMYLENNEKAKNPITIKNLFTMTAGFTYNLTSPEIQKVHDVKGKGATTMDFVRAIAKEPISFEPGTHWQYSLCHDVLAGFAETVSGKRFADLVQERIFEPIGMTRSAYHLNEKNEKTLAALYQFNDETKTADRIPTECSYTFTPQYDSGGAGIVSCVDDYILFADAMANKGMAKNGNRILSEKTVDLMRMNALEGQALSDMNWIQHEGYGYGLGVRTLMDCAKGGAIGQTGEFGWGGAAGAYALFDPENRVAMYYAQHMLNNLEPYTHPRLRNVLYACLGK